MKNFMVISNKLSFYAARSRPRQHRHTVAWHCAETDAAPSFRRPFRAQRLLPLPLLLFAVAFAPLLQLHLIPLKCYPFPRPSRHRFVCPFFPRVLWLHFVRSFCATAERCSVVLLQIGPGEIAFLKDKS